MRGRQIRQKCTFYPLRGIVFSPVFFFYENSGDETGSTVPKGTNLRVNALFKYECAPSFRNLPTVYILHKTVQI